MSATRPFEFVECLELREMLGRVAWDERELLAGIEDAPAGCIAYHTRSYFLRSRYLAAPYPNDFATWAAIQVRDRVLGERLAVIDPFDFSDVEQLRAELVSIIDHHLTTEQQTVPRADYGEPFHFMRSVLIEVPTGIAVQTLREFRDALARVDTSAIYFHFYESRRRPEADPLAWLQTELGRVDVATQLRRLNPYVSSLAGMRAQLLTACDVVLENSPR